MDLLKKRCYPRDPISLHEKPNKNKKPFLLDKKENYIDFGLDLNLLSLTQTKSKRADQNTKIDGEDEEKIKKHLIQTIENLPSTEVLDDSFCFDFIEQKWSNLKENKGFCGDTATNNNSQYNNSLFETNFPNVKQNGNGNGNEKKKLTIVHDDIMNDCGYCFISELDYEEKVGKVGLFEEDDLDCLLVSSLLPNQSIKNRGKLTLVLDLDQTLVYSSTKKPDQYDFKCIFKQKTLNLDQIIQNEEATEQIIYVQKRPNLEQFLEECAKLFEVVIFTAGIKEYADQVLDQIDPENSFISHRLYRDSCKKLEGSYFVKDLSLLGRKLEKCIIIDDQPYSYHLQPENAIPIQEFLGNINQETKDLQSQYMLNNELKRILKILQQFEKCENVYQFLEKMEKY
ncbi:nuclear lim interactor-interacting factor-related [Anaeramoeba flamelloides]|uniref:Nuclear lim interactor-interacting factor-related n=1 Tax=Anaeramoeba flamelloides TaxID=1746091 RepID=A0AAV7ZKJ6_9EUKA|nr:nuclear lim interactor-interacting factor-related [Anaeramoeba flamelloides]